MKKIESIPSIFFKDPFAHSQSLVNIDGMDSFKVNLFQRLTRVIRSLSGFFKDQKDLAGRIGFLSGRIGFWPGELAFFLG